MLLRLLREWLTGMPDTTTFLPLSTEDELDAAVERSHHEPVVIYKHSTTCSISARARHRLSGLDEGPPVYQVVVQHNRDVSRAVAERLGIKHQSPQAIVVYRGEPVDHVSHGRVAPRFVTDVVEQIEASS